MSEVCVLEDGRHVRFSLKRGIRDPFYLASFRGPDGKRKEPSTKESNKKRAADAAVVLIRDFYAPRISEKKEPTWDEAVASMKSHMETDNLRPKTIQQYVLVVSSLRKAFPTPKDPPPSPR